MPEHGESLLNLSRLALRGKRSVPRQQFEVVMRIFKALVIAAAMLASPCALAADYRAGYREPRGYGAPAETYVRPAYVPYVPPVYYLPSPPQYVQDLRTGAPGRWVQLEPSLLDRLFGEFRDGY